MSPFTLFNEFSDHSKTRYCNHSLASFLLDELSKIKDSPWEKACNHPQFKPYIPVVEIVNAHSHGGQGLIFAKPKSTLLSIAASSK